MIKEFKDRGAIFDTKLSFRSCINSIVVQVNQTLVDK